MLSLHRSSALTSTLPTRRILGVDFFIGPLEQAVELAITGAPAELEAQSSQLIASSSQLPAHSSELLASSSQLTAPSSPASRCALIVAPSAPGLAVDLVQSPAYRQALQTADLVLTDSGFMVLLWRLFTGEKLPRHSGLKFLRAVLARPELKQPSVVFWVMPSAEEDVCNRAWLQTQGFPVTSDDVYIAPAYPTTGELNDDVLAARIESRRPRVVMLAIGGGVQERLGLALRSQLLAPSSQRPVTSNQQPATSHQPPASILCLGAAIAFLTGGQASIPPWADRLILGWLFRLLSNPRKFWRRYWDALRLAPLLWHYRDQLPGSS